MLCDDRNVAAGDGCGEDCTLESCGDGEHACLNNCVEAACGDGVLFAPTEACDDGNVEDTDACLATCVAATCGDVGGGDFGLSLAPDAATCNGATVQGFDHHGAAYRMLNCGCQRHYLYSYSNVAADSDAGYDVNTGLGAWAATAACDGAEGGMLKFYAAMR